jgi:sulfhydrogenase subunit beta (sulfur reductase)
MDRRPGGSLAKGSTGGAPGGATSGEDARATSDSDSRRPSRAGCGRRGKGGGQDHGVAPSFVIGTDGLERLIGILCEGGRRVIGPTARDGAVVYAEIVGLDDLPRGWGDDQAPGRYRLRRRDDGAYFGYAVGPDSWKRLLFPPEVVLWRARSTEQGVDFEAPATESRYAFLGVRACELAAIRTQDRVLLESRFPDHDYAARRGDMLIVAVNCGSPSGACFCTSMGTGPRAHSGYDLALTELIDGHGHRFLLEVGSDRGQAIASRLPHRPAKPDDLGAAADVWAAARAGVRRAMDTADLPGLLRRNLEHARWDHVAARCLSCGNCTMVCPSCFCADFPEMGELESGHGERRRVWASCFSVAHARLHTGSVRRSGRSRYRQWLTHKVSTWEDQFGSSGCVGCGRCIAWCPAGIDITEEVAAIRATDGSTAQRIVGVS